MPYQLTHEKDLIPLEVMSRFMREGFSRVGCDCIHPLTCTRFCLNYVPSVWGNTYKTYAAVYVISLLFRYKKIAKK